MKVKREKVQGEPKMSVSESNLRKSAKRVLAQGTMVSTEIHYIQRTLGASATQTQIDDIIVAVRKMPLSSIALGD